MVFYGELWVVVVQGYFIPMLSFIPLALFGGLHTPSPWDGHYNQDAPEPNLPAKDRRHKFDW